MKKFFVFAFVAALSMTACNNGGATDSTASANVETVAATSSDFAYVSIEKVLSESEIYKTEGVALQEKTEKAQKAWAQKEQNLQYEAAQLQEKYQKGLITTSNAQQQQQSIEKKVASYQNSAQTEARKLEEENFVFTNRAQDLIQRAIKDINSDKKYKMIFNASALVDADSLLDISDNVLEAVNALYAKEKTQEKK